MSSIELDKMSSLPTCTDLCKVGPTLPESKFLPFRRMPLELRLKVWNNTMPGPRIVEIEYTSQWFAPLESRQEPSGLLRACTESRNEFLRKYKYLCRYAPSDYCSGVKSPETKPKHYFDKYANLTKYPFCYFNAEIDTMYIGASTMPQFPEADDGMKLQSEGLTFDSLTALSSNEFLPKPRFMGCHADWDMEDGIALRADQFEFLETMKKIFPTLEKFVVGMRDIDVAYFDHGVMSRFKGEIGFEEMEHEHLKQWEEKYAVYNDGQKISVGADGKILEAYGVALVLKGVWRGGESVHAWNEKFLRGLHLTWEF